MGSEILTSRVTKELIIPYLTFTNTNKREIKNKQCDNPRKLSDGGGAARGAPAGSWTAEARPYEYNIRESASCKLDQSHLFISGAPRSRYRDQNYDLRYNAATFSAHLLVNIAMKCSKVGCSVLS